MSEDILPGPLPQFLDAGRGTAKTVTHRAIAVRAVGHFLASLIDEQAAGRSQQGVPGRVVPATGAVERYRGHPVAHRYAGQTVSNARQC